MQSDDLGLRNKAVDQLTAEDRLRLHVHDDQTFAFTLDDAESLVPEIDALRAELAVKDAAIERLVAERDEAREAKSYLAATRNEQLRELTNANTELFWAGVQDVRRLTRMKAALKPFARLALKIPADRPDSDLGEVPTSWLRRARQALKDAP